jgi:hypothetical protein
MKAILLSLFFVGTLLAAPKVSLVNLPMHGKQPQVITDAKGMAHIVFLSGKERATDVFYVTRSGGKFSKPMKVNQIAGSAVAMGTIRGPHLALGKYGRVHVAWNGSQAGGGSPHHGSPMYYTRMSIDGIGFEKEHNLMTWTTALDGGGSVAADGKGHRARGVARRAKGQPEGRECAGRVCGDFDRRQQVVWKRENHQHKERHLRLLRVEKFCGWRGQTAHAVSRRAEICES